MILAGLRQRDLREPVTRAYLSAFAGASGSRARPRRADPDRVRDLAGALALKLDRASKTAERGSREAFRSVTADNLEDAQPVAVTAHVDEGGKRWPLGAYAAMVTGTLGRQATTMGTVDRVGEGLVVVEGASNDSICGPLIGWTGPASSAPQPPFHHGCQCALSPA